MESNNKINANSYHMNILRNSFFPICFFLLFLSFSLYLLYTLFSIVILFYLGFVLACVLKPIFDLLHKTIKINWLCALMCILFFVAILYLILTLLLPAFFMQAQTLKNTFLNTNWQLTTFLDKNIEEYVIIIQQTIIKNIDYIATYLLSLISAQGLSFLLFIGKFYFTILIGFYILKDWSLFEHKMEHKMEHLLPKKHSYSILQTCTQISHAIKALITGQFSIILILICYYSITLYLIGFPNFLLFGLLLGLGSLVPYIGIISMFLFTFLYGINMYGINMYAINTSVPNITAANITQSKDTIIHAVSFMQLYLLTGITILGNIFESSILYPYFLGKKLKIHPLMILLYLLSLSTLFGIGGVILSLPTIAVLHITVTKIYTKLAKIFFSENV